jgi:RND superfamily putative drug exporter
MGYLGKNFDFLTNIATSKPKSTFVITLSAIAIFLSSLLWLQVTPSSLSAIPSHLESARALDSVTSKVGIGVITPHTIVIDLGDEAKAQEFSDLRFEFAKKIASNPEVFTVASGDQWPYVDPTGQFIRLYIFGHHDLGAEETVELVRQLSDEYIPNSGFPDSTRFYLGGAPAQGVDLLNALSKTFPFVVILILLITFMILIRTFRSIVLSVKAIILDLISIGLSFSA